MIPDPIKKAARPVAEQRRAAAIGPDAGRKLAAVVAAGAKGLGLAGQPKNISAFFSMGTEIDTAPLIAWLTDAGHQVVLPVVVAKATPLAFRAWKPGEPLVSGGFGTSIPAPEAPELTPDVLFVPLLEFDRFGYRLGYGGGFYDRTLAKLRAEGRPLAIGIGIEAQRVDRVHVGPHDQRLDWLATDVSLRPAEIE